MRRYGRRQLGMEPIPPIVLNNEIFLEFLEIFAGIRLIDSTWQLPFLPNRPIFSIVFKIKLLL